MEKGPQKQEFITTCEAFIFPRAKRLCGIAEFTLLEIRSGNLTSIKRVQMDSLLNVVVVVVVVEVVVVVVIIIIVPKYKLQSKQQCRIDST